MSDRYARKVKPVIFHTTSNHTTITNVDKLIQDINFVSGCEEFKQLLTNTLVKFMGKKLATKCQLINTNTICIFGIYTIKEIDSLVNKMVKKYLVCSTCKLPEVNGLTCRACGAKQ